MAFPTGWTKRKQITLTNNDSAAKTGQPWEVVVGYDADMRSDFGDLRFSTDGTTLLRHCIVEAAAASTCRVFVEYPGTVPAGESVNFYCYYGAAAETDASTDDVFLWRQNFAQNANVVQVTQETNQFSVGGLTPPASPLTTPTYDGSGQAMHPSVLKFGSTWNGYLYWMAMTPYPGSNDNYENPSILVSNDGTTWSVPYGLTNPVVPAPADLANWNADPHLVYNPDTDELWMYYRTSYAVAQQSTLSITKSSDGVSWSSPAVLITWPYASDVASPAIIRMASNDWRMWAVSNITFKIQYWYSTDGETWAASPDGTTNIHEGWHIDVIYDVADSKFYMLNADKKVSPWANILWYESDDGESWSGYSVPLIAKGGDTSGTWDERLYRASLIKAGDDIEVFYSAFDSSSVWHTGRITGSISAAKQIMRRMAVGTIASGCSATVADGQLLLTSSNNLSGSAFAKSPYVAKNDFVVEFLRLRTSDRYGNASIGRGIILPYDVSQWNVYSQFGNSYGINSDIRHLLLRTTGLKTQTVLLDNLDGPNANVSAWNRMTFDASGVFAIKTDIGAGYSVLGSVTDPTYLGDAKYVSFSQGGYSGGAYGGISKISDVFAYPLVAAPSVSFGAEEVVGGVTFSASCGSTLSSSDIQASIARSLAASAAASLTSSDISVTTAASYLFSAACHASVSSSDILASILRNLTADSSASTTSSDILAAVARILIASADGSLTGSDIAVSIAAQKIFEASCNASLQSTDVLASILRQVSAQCDSSLTSQDITLAILRQLVASCAGSLTASDITVSTVAEKLFQAACAASLTSSDSALNIVRTLTCNCNGVISSSDSMLTIAGLITFLAECTASLSGSDVTASIARVLSAESLASVSASDISVFNLITLAGTCNPTVSATDVALSLQMYLQAICDGTLSADDASVSVASLLSAACGATISSSDIRVLFTDEFMLPEVFAAISKITKAYEAESLVTKTLNARSRIEIRRLN